MIKKWLMGALAVAGLTMLTGCGQLVEVPTAYIGKIKTSNGYKHGDAVIQPSKFRLSSCLFTVCESLIVMNTSDTVYHESFDLMMPKDKLILTFTADVGMSVLDERYNSLFNKIPSKAVDAHVSVIRNSEIYERYAQKRLRAVIQSYISQYSIADVISNREQINNGLILYIEKEIGNTIPFSINYAGLDNLVYPKVIVDAQNESAERKQQIETQNAQNNIELAKIALEEARITRDHSLAVRKANNDAEIKNIIASGMSDEYKFYRKMQVLEKLAESNNKTFVPLKMLDNVSSDILITK